MKTAAKSIPALVALGVIVAMLIGVLAMARVALAAPDGVNLHAGAGVPASAPNAQCTPSARTTAQVNLRQGPGTDYPVIMTLPAGVEVSVTGENQGASWFQIVYQGTQGWASAQYLRITCPQSVPVVNAQPVPPAPPGPPPPTPTPAPKTPGVSIAASSNSVPIGTCTVVYWTVSGADQVFVGTGSWQVPAALTGSQQVCPTMSTTYYVRTVTGGASKIYPLEITVVNPQNPANFRSNAYVLNPGLCATLSWNINDVNGVFLYINGAFQGVAGNSSQQVCVSKPSDYGLKVVYNTGQQVVTPLTINITNQPPDNIQFAASPATISQGECSTLSWIVGNAKSIVLIDPSSNSTSVIGSTGQIQVCPQQTVRYTIQAVINNNQTVQASQTVTVQAASPTAIP